MMSQEEKKQEVLDSQSKVGAAQSDQINFDEGD